MRFIIAFAGLLLASILPPPSVADTIGAADPAMPAGQVLTFSEPYDTYRDWMSISMHEEDGAIPPITRVRGDAFSRFYYLSRWDTDEVRSEDGTLLARVGESSTGLGIRKTPTRLTFILYHVSSTGLSRYHLIMIERGKARVYACRLDQATFEVAAQQHFPTMAALAAAQASISNYVIDLLQATEPVLTHCVARDNGVPRGKPDRQPVLRKAFPHVGDLFVSDDRGFKGGWLYSGYDEFGAGNRLCCSYVYAGEGRDAYVIGDRVRPGRDLIRIRLIFYVDGYVRSSRDCHVGNEHALIAVADATWKNGRAYLSDGRTVRIVRWTDTPPKGCEYQIPRDPGPRETLRIETGGIVPGP